MIIFFKTRQATVIAVEISRSMNASERDALAWLFGDAAVVDGDSVDGFFVGPRREMVTPWSTNAVEITQNMNVEGITRIEEFFPVASSDAEHDEMLQRMYVERRDRLSARRGATDGTQAYRL